MLLKELMRERMDVVKIQTDARISKTAELMRDHQIGSVVVVDESNVVIGIITDRDIALGLALDAATPDSFVSEIMSREVATVRDSISLFDLTQYFRTIDVKRLPVVDQDQRLLGIVSTDDVMSLLAREMYDTCCSLEPKLGHMV